MTSHYCSKGHENPSGSRFCLQCGEKLVLPVSKGIYPGLMLAARYRIVRQLGQGGFGRTYLAEDFHRFNEPCVLKEFAPQVQGTYALEKATELFEREAGVLYKLQHPQIPRFREMFRVQQEDKAFLFLVQDFVAGQTYHALLDALKHQGLRFSESEVTQLMLQILPVLEYIHSLGVIHRDISPDNLILRSTDGLPVLIDFGGVKQVAATVASQVMGAQGAGGMPPVATRLGKFGYAPPEQMQGGIVYPHSDLYALAATVLVLLTGKQPQELIDPRTFVWNWRYEVSLSPMLGNVLDKMLQLRISDRFARASEVLEALKPQPVAIAHPPIPPRLPKTQATLAVAPPEPVAPVNPPSPPKAGTPLLSSTGNPSSGQLRKILLACVLIAAAGVVGWGAGNLWIWSQTQSNATNKQPTPDNSVTSPPDNPKPDSTPQFSAEEQQRKEALQQRRVALNIRHKFYVDLVNEEFWTQYPERRGSTLGTGPEDAQARVQWDAIASDLLRQLAQMDLSETSRSQMGRYGDADRDRWKSEANQLHLSSRTLYDFADTKFYRQFPQLKGKDFLNKPIGQVWYAMVTDALNSLKSGDTLQRIVFDPGAVSKQVSGTLKLGEGRALIASLAAGQVMKVKLSTAQSALFSIYGPSSKTTLLEDSRDRTWSGQLPESGFYEFVIVSDGSESINYQFDITVENSATPVPSPVKSAEPSPVGSAG